MSKLATRLTALLLSGMLVIGSAPVGGFAAELGQTSEVAVEEAAAEEAVASETEGEVAAGDTAAPPEEAVAAEATGDTAAPAEEVVEEQGITGATDVPAEEAAGDQALTGTTDTPAEEAAQYYTVTLDANGGYFVNEWDDAVGDYVERAEVVTKKIPVGGTVTNIVPIMEQENAVATFLGWSLEPDGELVSQAEEEYIPGENCVLYAAWQVEETEEIEGPETALPETNAEESIQDETNEDVQDENSEVIQEDTQGETNEDVQEDNPVEFAAEGETAQEDYSQETVVEEETAQEEDFLDQAVEEETQQEEDSLNAEDSQEIEESSVTEEVSEVIDEDLQDDQTAITEEDDQQEVVSSNPVYSNLGEGTPEDFEENSVPISMGNQYIGVSVKEGTLYKFVSRENDTYTFCSECEYDTIGTLFGEIDGDMYALALDDNSGADNNFSTSYELEEDKTYYLGVIFADYETGSGTRAIMLNVTRENCTEHYPMEGSGVYTEATCLDRGYYTYNCSECGKEYKDDFSFPNGHSPLEDSGVVKEPTCSEKGYTTYTCSVCGLEYIDDYTDPIDHYPEEDSGIVTEPTCLEGGYTTYICSQCGEEYKDDYTDPVAHECDEDCKCIFCGMEFPYFIKNAESYTDEQTGENYVTVDYRLDTSKDCRVLVEIYEEGTDYCSFYGHKYIYSKGENRINVKVEGYVYGLDELPENYIIKAYLDDSSTCEIISNIYENYLHTKAFADLLNSNPEDYDEERTIEFSEDNFGVFSENTVILYGNDDLNSIRDYSGNTYIIENADEMAEKLKDGCELAYFYEDELKIIAHVLTASSSQNKTIIIETEDPALEDVFDYLKVEDTVDVSECSVDTSNLPEGVTFSGAVDDNENESLSEDSVTSNAMNGAVVDSENVIDESDTYETTAEDAKNAGYSGGKLRFDFDKVPFNDKAEVNGYITVGLSPSIQILVTESQTIYTIDMDVPVSLNISSTGHFDKTLPLGNFFIPVLNGAFMINARPKAFISLEGGISYSTIFSASLMYDNKNGMKVTGSCNSDDSRIEQIFGKGKAGVEIEAFLFAGGCRFIYIPCKVGGVLSASFAEKIPENEQEEGDHICQNCIKGDLCGFFSTEPQIVKIKNTTFGKKYYELTYKINDYYYSLDYKDIGWGKCPHIRDKNGNDAGENGGDNEEDDEDEGGSYAFIAFDVATQKLICLGSGSLIIGDEFLIIPEKYYLEGMPDYDLYDDMPELHNGKVAQFKKGDPEYQYIPWVYFGDAYYTSIQKLQKYGYSFDTVEISNNVTNIYCYDNWIKRISIPSSVISLFISNDFIESLSIPSSVKELYVNCDNLKTLTVPANVKSMEVGYCESLKTITISQGVESVYIHDNESLETISTPQGCKRVEIGYCSNLKKVEIAEGPNDIFIYWCPNVREIEMPNHAKNIDFTACESLEKIDIPEGVTIIDAYIFDGCKSLKHITIPNTVTRIESDAFLGCDFQSIVIPDSVRIIGDRAFESNNNLTSVVFPEGLKSIGDFAFYGCSNLINVSFPSTLPDIGKYAFWDTAWANNLDECYPVFNGTLLYTYDGREQINIPSNVRRIGNGAFSNYIYNYHFNLLSVTIPSSVTSIGREAFWGCNLLERIKIPSSVTNIGKEAFCDCTNLKSIIIPSSVVCIGEHAFHYYTNGYDDDLEEGYYPLQNLVIYGETGSYAEQYAKRNNIPFSEYNKKDITEATVTVNSKTYTGNAVTPKPVVSFYGTTLQENTDYTVSYYDNTNAGKAYVTITGTGNYEGSITESFKINKATQTFSIKATASSIEVGKTMTIKPSGNNGTVTYKSSNTNVATVDKTTGKITAKKVGSVIITATAAETRNYKKASKTITVTVTKGTQAITVKAAASSVAVDKTTTVSTTGAQGTVTYKSSDTTVATVTKSTGKVTAKKVGKVTITATAAATANYKAASKTVTIKVVPAATASLTAANQATGIKLTWKKVIGATGYLVYRGSTKIATIKSGSTVTYTDTKANTNGGKYTFKIIPTSSYGNGLAKSLTTYRVARPAISSVANSASKKMTVKWGKNVKGSGYQIHYCTDKTFKSGNKSVSITSASTVSKVIGSLTKGKTYYVRIRTYKTVGSTKYFSAWSPVKSVKISK